MSLRLVLISALALAACVTTASATGEAKASGPERVAIVNQSPFDVATCGPRAVMMPATTQGSIIGALTMAQPSVLECLVDPKARGPEGQTHARVTATVKGAEASYEVSGQNLTPDGKACVEAAVKRQALGTAPDEKPVSATLELVHVAGVSPTVKLGVNEPSDVVGAVRLGQKDFCECYTPLAHQPPPTLEATLELAPEKAVAVSFEPVEGAAAQTVSACVKRKLETMALPKVKAPVKVPYLFALVDSFAEKQTERASDALQFAQLEAIRAQKNASVAIASGTRDLAAVTYDALGARYKAKPTGALIPELKEKCKAVLDGDAAQLESLAALVATTQALVTFAQDLSLKDLTWAEAARRSQEQLVKVQADQANVDKQRQNDEAACPKFK